MTSTPFTISHEPLLLFDIDQAELPAASRLNAEHAAVTVLSLGKIAMRFARVERVPRYDEHSRENDAEHSFMLSLVASEIAHEYFPTLDHGLVAQFSNVHDLVELETNDVATFTLDDAALAAKESAEHRALGAVLRQLPHFTRELLQRYELQREPEARFVRLVDKILPYIADIAGPGKKIMVEDYGITQIEQLEANELRLSNQFRQRFPDEDLEFIHRVRAILATQFSRLFESSV